MAIRQLADPNYIHQYLYCLILHGYFVYFYSETTYVELLRINV
ncbi:hypothetical protein CLV99_3772 [Sphingobacterium yanglingense]|uniref:Uncharacterized protein n=1 Tax=Sphingobacterium yanglingense TaxID=1437280 RepID=A0A4R6W839_9SPHI|nr:hypothetical protein CLV99_3772 [Sphingobacterium yanglingense]